MSRDSNRLTEGPLQRQDVVLVSPDDSFLVDDIQDRHNYEHTIARLRLLWERRRYLWKVFACGLLASLVIAFLIPSRYESTAQLMPPDQQSGAGGLAMLAGLAGKAGDSLGGMAGLAGNLLGLKTSGDLFIGVLGSRTVQDDLINKFDLRKVYGDRNWEDARKDLAKRTDLSADKKSGIITIKVTDRSPQRAAAMGYEYINQLNWVMTQLNTSSAHRERVFLEGRLQQVKQDLENAEKEFSQFASKNAALDVPAQGKAMVEATAELEGELIAAQTELQGLKQIYTDGNVRVRSTQARISELERQLQKLGGDPNAASNAEAQADPLYPSIRQLPLLGVGYADLLRRSKIQEAIYETLTQQYELAKVEEAKEIPSVKVLDPPDTPEKKAFPPRGLITVLGGFAVLAIAITGMLGRVRWQETDPQDPGKALMQEMANDVRAKMPWVFRNGLSPNGVTALANGNEDTKSANKDSGGSTH